MSRVYEALLRAEQEREASDSDSLISSMPALEADIVDVTSDSPRLRRDRPQEVKSENPRHELLRQFAAHEWVPENETLLFSSGKCSPVLTEQFRILRSKIYQERTRRHLKTVLVTSAVPGEGKSFVSMNLAQAIGQQPDRRPLLIDGDLRRSTIHKSLGAKRSPGLSDYLHGQAEFSDVLQASSNLGICFIASGERPSSSDLFQSKRMRALLDEATSMFDWIVIDSPPLTLLSDSIALSDYCDGILTVVSNGTSIDMAQKLRKELTGKKVIGTVFNRAEHTAQYNYYVNNNKLPMR